MNFGRTAAARYLFLAAWGVAYFLAAPVAAEEVPGYAMPSREKIIAMLTALFHHQSAVYSDGAAHSLTPQAFTSISPGHAYEKRVRGKIVAFSDSLVYEGGFYPREVYALFGYDNLTTARIAQKIRQLDSALGVQTSPWEVAGRVGRSGSVPSDVPLSAMNSGRDDFRSSGPFVLLPVLATAYAVYPDDGLNAAGRLFILQDDDPRAEAVGRAAFSLLCRILSAKGHDKDAWLRQAASDMRDSDSEHELRAVRVKDWRYLRGEECVMGRLERAVYLWYHGSGYERTMSEGRKFLQSRETLDYLAALAGVTYGLQSLPTDVLSGGSSDGKLRDMVHDLYDLATSEAVLRVAPEIEVDD